MELPLEVRRDAAEYLRIFNDYTDFKIKPWDKHGADKGKLFPVRKNALRILKKEIVLQKQAEWDKAHGGNEDNQQNQKDQQEYDHLPDPRELVESKQQTPTSQVFAERKSQRTERDRVKYSSGGEKYTEIITNTAEFPVPGIEDVENWNEDSWMRYAAPLELEEYFRAHPEKKPPGWVNPSETLKTREELKDEKAKLKQEEYERAKRAQLPGGGSAPF